MSKFIEKITWLPYNILCKIKDDKKEFAELDLRRIGINRKFRIKTSPEDEGSSAQLRVFKIREPVNSKYYYKFVDKEDIVLDLGANIGDTSILSSRAKKIIAVEPLQQAILYLKENLIINDLEDKSEVLRMAVGEKGRLLLEENKKLNWSKIVDKPNEKTQTVRSEPLAYFVKKYKTNFLRMDVEGYEYEILYNKIPKQINKISIEFHTALLGDDKVDKLLEYFDREGFKARYIIEDLPIRLYPFLWILGKTRLINKFTYVKKDQNLLDNINLIKKGRAQKYLFLER